MGVFFERTEGGEKQRVPCKHNPGLIGVDVACKQYSGAVFVGSRMRLLRFGRPHGLDRLGCQIG